MEFKVFKTKIKILPHYNAENLEIGKVGQYQVVVQKGLYKDGDDCFFIPEKAVLPPQLKTHWENYLKGPEKNRVGNIRLRGEYSQGIILNKDEASKVMNGLYCPYDEDVSERLGIKEYVPIIPAQFAGKLAKMPNLAYFKKHDVVQLGAYIDEFVIGEEIVVTEKLHGSLLSIYFEGQTKKVTITSKGLAKQHIQILEDETNIYWRAWRNFAKDNPAELSWDNDWQIFAEVLPCQKGFNYGFTEPRIKIFRYLEDGKDTDIYDPKTRGDNDLFVPLLYKGPLTDWNEIRKLAEGKEQVSGKELHIKEGVVVSPSKFRFASDGTPLLVKILNSKYKESGEEFN